MGDDRNINIGLGGVFWVSDPSSFLGCLSFGLIMVGGVCGSLYKICGVVGLSYVPSLHIWKHEWGNVGVGEYMPSLTRSLALLPFLFPSLSIHTNFSFLENFLFFSCFLSSLT